MEINFSPNLKQDLVFQYFDDELTTEILYGGGVGGGKSYLLGALLIMKALQYPGIRIGLARNTISDLKKTTVISFFEVAQDWGVSNLFVYNSSSGIIKFKNGSEIILVGLEYQPSDPLYVKLGGHLWTFGVIDELSEVDETGYNIFNTRIGRWKNDHFGIKPICISTCNPAKNWLYSTFYKKSVDGTLEPFKKFIQALPTDNPNLPDSYLLKLSTKSQAEKERLLFGNWDYDSNPTDLMSQESILNIFENIAPPKPNSKKYITADIAFTSDKMVVMLWEDYVVKDIFINPPGNIEDFIKNLAADNKVSNFNIAYDSDGVGQFLKKRLTGSKNINNGGKALKDENYANLKTQLYFKLAEKVNDNSVKVKSEIYKKEIIQELQVVRHQPSTDVGKIKMISKDEVKRLIGRSPDFSDAMAYRMVFEFGATTERTFTFL
jgi:phage terminase large subunit